MCSDLTQTPAPGERLLRHAGDLLSLRLHLRRPCRGTAFVRTNLGRGGIARRERISFVENSQPLTAAEWHDLPMRPVAAGEYSIRLPLTEVGEFAAKACFLPEGASRPLWPEGSNLTIKVAPAWTLRANTIYTAFVRQFPPPRAAGAKTEQKAAALDRLGYTVIPPSGTFRGLISRLDHIIGRLGFRVLQLLPVHPAPVTFARMGRYGSPFAALDFMTVDPALAEFDRKTTPLDQFRELIDAVHARGGRLFMDLPANHTGWASTLQNHHPEWFRRNDNGTFRSPGAWGVVWQDLVELDYERDGVGAAMAEVFLFWCAQGVDGFRCDAGYMIPEHVWSYIVSKTRDSYPDTVFLLEGLGGKISVTEKLLRTSNLDWAYSEIFQTGDRWHFESYLPGAIALSTRTGPLVHYAETHDNLRLAAGGETYSRLRVALAALLSHQGAFGITSGVEWFARERIDVHGAPSLRWGARRNQVAAVRRLNLLLNSHPAFAAQVAPRSVTRGSDNTLAALRDYGSGRLLIAANLDPRQPQSTEWPRVDFAPAVCRDLLTGNKVEPLDKGDTMSLSLAAGEVVCLEPETAVSRLPSSRKLSGTPPAVGGQILRLTALRLRQWLLDSPVAGGPAATGADLDEDQDPDELGRQLAADFRAFCRRFSTNGGPPPIVTWRWPEDARRTVPCPPGYLLALEAPTPFQVRLTNPAATNSPAFGDTGGGESYREETAGEAWSIPVAGGRQVAFLKPPPSGGSEHRPCKLRMTRFADGGAERLVASLLILSPGTAVGQRLRFTGSETRQNGFLALLANGRGAMAHVRARWGEIRSQYDSLLAANLHPEVPVDRTVVLTRCRAWVVARAYSQAIDADMLDSFTVSPEGTRADWNFLAPVGGGRRAPLSLSLVMSRDRNRLTIRVSRRAGEGRPGLEPDQSPVEIILRPDIEWRGFHEKTKAYRGAETAWPAAIREVEDGFTFDPFDHCLRLRCRNSSFQMQPEWMYMVAHPEDAERGMDGSSDLFSPGFFRLELAGGETAYLVAEIGAAGEIPAACPEDDWPPLRTEREPLAASLVRAMRAYIVRRGQLCTVIAGYPWFLDWGRDTLIFLRGMIASGMTGQATNILAEFGRHERGGTLPNMISGEDKANRDTSDAPLWFLLAAADLAGKIGARQTLDTDCGGRKLGQVAASILDNYLEGTANGIKADPASGLIYSPPHFTWMDTDHPAGSPRGGYPVEIQALWLAGLRFAARHLGSERWCLLHRQAADSFQRLFTREKFDHLCDCRHGQPETGAAAAEPDDAVRSNGILALALGAVANRSRARRALSACEILLVPGAVRSLADRKTRRRLEIRLDGRLLGDPEHPYRGRYLGDEDRQRKPAYHNGTAWTWVMPSYAEALWRLYGEPARPTALALLGSVAEWTHRGCAGQVPEILDGDTPHTPRGCGAQAWGVSEFVRVWHTMQETAPAGHRGKDRPVRSPNQS